MGMKPCKACVCIHITLISNGTASGQDMDSPLNLLFADGIGTESHFTSEVITRPVLWELIVMGLEFTHFIWRLCLVISISKPGPTACCAWQVLCIHFLHQREVWRSVSITGLYSHLWHSIVLLLSVSVKDVVCLSRPAKDSSILQFFLRESHFNNNRHRRGMSSGENPFLCDWLSLETSDRHGNRITN